MSVVASNVVEEEGESLDSLGIIGSLPSRVVAVFFDYIAVAMLFMLGVNFVGSWAALIGGVVYFTILGSELGGGSTLGKKIVGLKVVTLTDNEFRLLSPLRAAARYMLSIGLLIVLAELPPALYRHWGIVGRVPLLELHMLPVLGYMVANVLRVIFDPLRQGLHDRICRTLVVRNSIPTDREALDPDRQKLLQSGLPHPLSFLIPVFGATSGGLFWVLSISQPPDVEALMSIRYRIEHDFPVEIVGVSVKGKEGIVDAIQQPDASVKAEAMAARVLQILNSRPIEGAGPWESVRVKLTVPAADSSADPLTIEGVARTGSEAPAQPQ